MIMGPAENTKKTLLLNRLTRGFFKVLQVNI
jgi:hypothetical protein